MKIEEFLGLHGRSDSFSDEMKSSPSEDLYNLILEEIDDEFFLNEEVEKLLENGAQSRIKTPGQI